MRAILTRNADVASYLMADESHLYTGVGKRFAGHHTVRHSVPPAVGETRCWSLRGQGRGLKLLVAERGG